VCYFR